MGLPQLSGGENGCPGSNWVAVELQALENAGKHSRTGYPTSADRGVRGTPAAFYKCIQSLMDTHSLIYLMLALQNSKSAFFNIILFH